MSEFPTWCSRRIRLPRLKYNRAREEACLRPKESRKASVLEPPTALRSHPRNGGSIVPRKFIFARFPFSVFLALCVLGVPLLAVQAILRRQEGEHLDLRWEVGRAATTGIAGVVGLSEERAGRQLFPAPFFFSGSAYSNAQRSCSVACDPGMIKFIFDGTSEMPMAAVARSFTVQRKTVLRGDDGALGFIYQHGTSQFA